ncbi:hypothetical protein [Nocardiopsis synnemataformans]|uniref:TPR repeat region-containing protein n=1 Tax=Nocardiopsis synnemataformans TaxID=61305 RepID=UPI003EBBECDD
MGEILISFEQDDIDDFRVTADSIKEEFQILESRLLGRAGDLSGSFDSAAQQFTDIVAWDISSASQEDYQLWVEASTNIRFLVGVADRWAKCIQAFWDEHNEIYRVWRESKSAKENQVPDKYSSITFFRPDRGLLDWDANKARDLYDELREIRSELNERAQKNMQDHEERVAEIAGMFSEGPTELNVQKLVDGGNTDWGFASINPSEYLELDQELTPESAEEAAEELADYWSGEKPLDHRYEELMLVLSMLSLNARHSQNEGTDHQPEEMDFLDAFYDELERRQPGGVIDIPTSMEGDHMSDEERDRALGILGDGLLTLSDHRLGGGYDDLPTSVREAAEGPHLTPTGSTPPSSHTWAEDAQSLAAMLGSAHESMEPGYGLSMTLSLSMGMYSDEYSEVMDQFIPEDDVLSLVDVANRNKDAMHDLFAGVENEDGEREPYVHPNLMGTYEDEDGQFHRFSPHTEQWGSPEEMINTAVEGLFTHQWEDDGETVGDMIEWIAQGAHSEDQQEQDRAGRAAAGFVEMITTAEMQEALTNTGVDVTEDGEEYTDASFTAFNTELAEELGDVFDAYIYSFAGGEITDSDDDTTPLTGVGEYDSSYNGFTIGPQERAAYLQYLMGNDDTASSVINSASTYQHLEMEAYLETGDQYSTARGAATLYSLIDVALEAEAENRRLDLQGAEDRKEQIYTFALEKVGEYSAKVPVVGEGISNALGLGSEWITSQLTDEDISTSPRYPTSENPESRNREHQLIFLEHIANSESVHIDQRAPQEFMDKLEKFGVLSTESDGSVVVEMERSNWSISDAPGNNIDALDSALAGVLNGTQITPSDRVTTSAEDMAGSFSGPYDDRHGLIQEHAPRNIEEIEDEEPEEPEEESK